MNNFLPCILSVIFFNYYAIADHVVTVIHPVPVTVFYDPILQSVYPAASNEGSHQANPGSGSGVIAEEAAGTEEGRVNAKGTSSMTASHSISSRAKFSTLPTDATTDANSAFRMNTSLIFGTVAAVVLAAFIF